MSFGTRICVLAGLLALLPLDTQAAVRQVPAQYPTIQGAVSAASVGDTILVAPGTYFENVVIDRRVALVSEAGAEVTTIDGRQLGPVILVRKQADHASIEGFRVTHGSASTYAGGINVEIDFGMGGYATIRRNIIEHNYSSGQAGGLYAVRHSIVQDNIIQYNNEHISKGIAAMEVSGVIERNLVRKNTYGLYTVVVSGTETFAWNTVVGDDFVIYVRFGNGGAIFNNTFALTHNDNADWTVRLFGSIPFEFRNNLIVHGAGGGLSCGGSGSYVISCNDVWGVGPSYLGDCEGLEGVDGNFSADPLFCGTDDYRLSAASPCLAENSPVDCGLIGALGSCDVLAINEPASVPALSRLEVSPNPSSGEVVFSIPGVTTPFTLELYDAHGRQVDVLRLIAGDVTWNPRRELTSGIYFARKTLPNPAVVKFVLLR